MKHMARQRLPGHRPPACSPGWCLQGLCMSWSLHSHPFHTHSFTHGFTGTHMHTYFHVDPWAYISTHVVSHVNPQDAHTYMLSYMGPWGGACTCTHVIPHRHPQWHLHVHNPILTLGSFSCSASTATMPLQKGTRARHLHQMAPLPPPLRSE
jgi:hypothetical protein